MLEYTETPVVELSHPLMKEAGVQLLIKREDLNHRLISGNKWWKLKYNLANAVALGHHTLLTFGGAYSNHIYASAAACEESGLRSIGIIRGEKILPLNPTLSFAEKKGMHLHFVNRGFYRQRDEPDSLAQLEKLFGKFYRVPEGGTNLEGIKGAEEFVEKIKDISFDVLLVPVGTGGTISGIISGLNGEKKIFGVPVLKAGDFLRLKIIEQLKSHRQREFDDWHLLTEYHHGGYAKTTYELLQFIKMMKHQFNIPLDQVYTGKLLFAIFEEIRKGSYKRGTTILAIHTGGLQGTSTLDFT